MGSDWRSSEQWICWLKLPSHVKHLALEKTHCLREGRVTGSAGRGALQRADRVGKDYAIQIHWKESVGADVWRDPFMDHCVNLGYTLWSLRDGSASPGQHQLHQSRGCELGVCCIKNKTKSRVNTSFIVLSTCPICCLVQLLQCPIPLPMSVPAPLLTLLLFAFAVLVILFIIESLTLCMSALGSRVHWD